MVRRFVSAVRSWPPGCGPNAPPLPPLPPPPPAPPVPEPESNSDPEPIEVESEEEEEELNIIAPNPPPPVHQAPNFPDDNDMGEIAFEQPQGGWGEYLARQCELVRRANLKRKQKVGEGPKPSFDAEAGSSRPKGTIEDLFYRPEMNIDFSKNTGGWLEEPTSDDSDDE